MKNKLSARILVFFTLIMALQTIVVTLFIYQSIRSLFTSNIEKSDLSMAKEISVMLSVAKEQTGSWEFLSGSLGMGIMRGMGINRPFGGMHWNEIPAVLLDGNGNVLFSNVYIQGYTAQDFIRNAVKVIVNGNTDAYLLIGSMLDLSLGETERLFLNNILGILSLAGLGGILIWTACGWIYLTKAFHPLKILALAMNDVRTGSYDQTLPVMRKDEVGSLTQKFNEMTMALKEDQEYKKRLIADTAHELRTPLAVIQASLEMIIDGHYKADEERLRGLYGEVMRFSGLVQKMHDLSVIDGQVQTASEVFCDAGKAIAKSYGLFSVQAKASEVDLNFGSSCENILVRIPESDVMQISANLLSNAFKAVEGKADARISVNLEVQDEELVWNVDDNGSGIAAENREKVFERFYRVDEARSRETGGSGLGLAIVSTLVQKSKASVQVLDSPLGGARLQIRLPLVNGPQTGEGS